MHDDIHALAGWYALGLLEGPEREAFERHLALGCDRCRHELAEHGEGLGVVALSGGVQPPDGLRDQMLARARGDRPLDQWIELAETGGVVRKRIGAAELVRIPDGVTYGLVYEEWFVTSGAPIVDDAVAAVGDYGEARSTRARATARDGATELFVVPRHPATIAARPRIDRLEQAHWLPYGPGVEVRLLRHESNRAFLAQLRMAPGGVLPEHDHAGAEESLLLRGTCRVGERTFGAGDVLRMPAGSHHDPVESDAGCEMIVLLTGAA